MNRAAPLPITWNLAEEDKAPYFLCDEPVSVRDLRRLLREGDPDERLRYTARILREARFDDVWRFLTLREVVAQWEALRPRLGWSLGFWEFLLAVWKRRGLVA